MATAWDTSGLETPPGRGEGLRVLVVEDDADGPVTTAHLLRLEGHQVRIAATGPAALAEATAHPPDVVLLDVGLPGMDGWDLARRLRERARQAQPVIIAVSGYPREADRLHSREAGVDFHLAKPADPEWLCHLLRRFQDLLGR